MELDENAQQLPHLPWFLTGVMTPWSLQSTESGKSSSLISFLLFGANLVLARARVLGRPLAYVATNSSLYREIIEKVNFYWDFLGLDKNTLIGPQTWSPPSSSCVSLSCAARSFSNCS